MSEAVTYRGAILRSDATWSVCWPSPGGDAYLIHVHFTEDAWHRADVAYDEPLLPSHGRLRAGKPEPFSGPVNPLAYVSERTMRAIDTAMAREVRAVQFESRHTPREHTERAVHF